MSTIKWSKANQGVTVAEVRASAETLLANLKAAKDTNRDGYIDARELKRVLAGKSSDEWSLTMGHFNSVMGFLHGDLKRSELKQYVTRFVKEVSAADANHDGVLSLTELRTLKNRGQERLVEFATNTRGDAATEKILRDSVTHNDEIGDGTDHVRGIKVSELPSSVRSSMKAAIAKAEADLGGESQETGLYQVFNEDDGELVGYVAHMFAWGEPDWHGSQIVGFDTKGKQLFNEYEDIS